VAQAVLRMGSVHFSDSVHPPVTCGARCVYAAYLSSSGLAIILLLLAVAQNQPRLAVGALFAAASVLLLRAYLVSAGLLRACVEEDDAPLGFQPSPATATRPESELLLARCEELARRRGTNPADP